MGAGFGQYDYNNLYVYANGWAVCDYDDFNDYG
ncbi:hypothetical protein ABIE54_004906 [Chitinophagaceae bacterium OAS944]